MTVEIRRLWNGTTIPALGLGCWAVGGAFFIGERSNSWGDVDDAVSLRAIAAAVDLGIRLFDTAPAYGTGHSEELLGQALHNRPDVLISTKVGYGIDAATKQLTGERINPKDVAEDIEQSLRRLKRDCIDIAFLHLNEAAIETAEPVFECLGRMRDQGKIQAFGWSTDFPERAAAFAAKPGFVAIQHAMNVFFKASQLLPVIEQNDLLSFNRSPLAMGLLGGKYSSQSMISKHDVRSHDADWQDYFKNGQVSPRHLQMLEAVKDLLQLDGRSLVQGALAWLWARSDRSIPIPGFRNAQQVQDICGTLQRGPLTADVMTEIERVINRPDEGEPRCR
jgi:aryl-alcohol dehydrogenase-like predicted oxidoreductase